MTNVYGVRNAARRITGCLAACALVAACGADGGPTATGATPSGTLTVFAAASLTDAFTEIGEAFTDLHPDLDVTFSFGGSADLVRQIDEGAPADVFASADLSNMDALTEAANHASEPVVFATNRAEIIVAAGNPEGITGVTDLTRDDLVVIGCSPEVPCGHYAQQVLANAGATVTFKSLEQNVRAVVAKVTIGEADAGIVYATDVRSAGQAAEGVAIPADINVVAEYPIVVTKEPRNAAAAQAFVDFVLARDGQEILARHGFQSP